MKNGVNPLTREVVFFPVHIPVPTPGHWIVLVAFMHSRTIVCYNSFNQGTDRMSSLQIALSIIKEEYNYRQASTPFEEDTWTLRQRPLVEPPQQKDGCSCGIAVLMTIRFIAEQRVLDYGLYQTCLLYTSPSPRDRG